VLGDPAPTAYGRDMSERVWMITGTSSGFGREIAQTALRAGDQVVATARRVESLDDLVASAPDRVLAVPLDVTRDDQIEPAVAAALDRFGRIDVLVNNAGHGSVGAIEEIDMNEFRELMDTMFFGAMALTQAVLPHMREQGNGAIVSISSMGGQLSTAGFGAYCSAKWALEAISSALSEEVAPFGIRVLIVEPGQFRTEFGGSRMQRSPEIAAYAETVGPTRQFVDDMDGTQEGDPAKAAAAILEVLDSDDPPLRLALGNDAVDAIRGEHARRGADLDAWERLSRAAVYEDAAA
jgi:NAD(P)-dependent dehydrogenase (short-subunit alcohol dehydrogenase family)